LINNLFSIGYSHINKSTQMTSPLQDLKIKSSISKSSHSKRSCGPLHFKYKSHEFVQKFDAFSTSEQVIFEGKLYHFI